MHFSRRYRFKRLNRRNEAFTNEIACQMRNVFALWNLYAKRKKETKKKPVKGKELMYHFIRNAKKN